MDDNEDTVATEDVVEEADAGIGFTTVYQSDPDTYAIRLRHAVINHSSTCDAEKSRFLQRVGLPLLAEDLDTYKERVRGIILDDFGDTEATRRFMEQGHITPPRPPLRRTTIILQIDHRRPPTPDSESGGLSSAILRYVGNLPGVEGVTFRPELEMGERADIFRGKGVYTEAAEGRRNI